MNEYRIIESISSYSTVRHTPSVLSWGRFCPPRTPNRPLRFEGAEWNGLKIKSNQKIIEGILIPDRTGPIRFQQAEGIITVVLYYCTVLLGGIEHRARLKSLIPDSWLTVK